MLVWGLLGSVSYSVVPLYLIEAIGSYGKRCLENSLLLDGISGRMKML